ncbi:MAG: hypothetical protein JO200_01265, partial [Comamonas sp.]|nr:hypothetical protein [Comamonas sp.]
MMLRGTFRSGLAMVAVAGRVAGCASAPGGDSAASAGQASPQTLQRQADFAKDLPPEDAEDR